MQQHHLFLENECQFEQLEDRRENTILGLQCELGECVENGPNIWEVLVGTFVVAVSTKHRSALHAAFGKVFEDVALPFLAVIVLPV